MVRHNLKIVDYERHSNRSHHIPEPLVDVVLHVADGGLDAEVGVLQDDGPAGQPGQQVAVRLHRGLVQPNLVPARRSGHVWLVVSMVRGQNRSKLVEGDVLMIISGNNASKNDCPTVGSDESK